MSNPALIKTYREGFLQGLENAYLVAFWLAALAITMSLFLPKWSKTKSLSAEEEAELSVSTSPEI
jgi:threonine/homoserine/homoserine lactone efflux protein